MDIRIADPDDPALLALMQEHLRSMRAHSPPGSVHALEPDAIRDPAMSFWCCWRDDQLLGCGALKALGDGHGEIKSMITSPDHLRTGVASALLAFITGQARTRGYTRLSLETGSGPMFLPAQRLYARHGFRVSGPFAEYVEDDFAVFMSKKLV